MEKYLFFICLQVFLFSSYLHAQWIQTYGPYGGNISTVAISGNKVAASARFISTDAGKSWRSIDPDLQIKYAGKLLYKGDTILAGDVYGGLYISTDNGTNWAQNTNGLNTYTNITALAYTGSSLFAGTDSGLYKSTDNGSKWFKIENGLNNIYVSSIAANDNKVVMSTRSGLFISFDRGSSWQLVNSEQQGQYYEGKVVFNGNNILLASSNKGVLISTDDGSTWNVSNQGLGDYKEWILSLGSDGNSVFLGCMNSSLEPGFFRSTDNGLSWLPVNNGFPAGLRVLDIAASGIGIFAATMGGGIIISTDGGFTWNESNNGLTDLDIACLAARGDSLFAGTSYAGIHLSTDEGLNFKKIYKLYSDYYVRTFIFDSKNIYAATGGQGILRSTDNGLTWEGIGLVSVSSMTFHKEKLFAARDADPGHFGGLYYTTDQGISWTKVTSGLPNVQDAHSVTSNGKTIFVIALENIYSSTDDGLSWNLSIKGIVGKIISLVKTKNNAVFAAAKSGELYRSTNDGAEWEPVNNGLPGNAVTSLAFLGESMVFAGTESGGVYLSVDNGLSWKAVNSNLTVKNIKDLAIKGSYIFAAANSTVWKRLLSEMIPLLPGIPQLLSVSNNSKDQPLDLALSWKESSGAETYQLQVAKDSLFNEIVLNDSLLTKLSRDVKGLLNSTTYYWRVRARNSAGVSPWSEVWKFTTIQALAEAPVLLVPKNSSIDNPLTITFSWKPNKNTDQYRLSVSEDDMFTKIYVHDSTLTDTLKEVKDLKEGMKYYWKVCSRNSAGEGPFSEVWNLTTVLNAPEELEASVQGKKKIHLQWKDKSKDETGFVIERKQDQDFAAIDTVKANTTNYKDSLDSQASTFQYRVKAYTPFATSAYSNTVSVSLTGVSELAFIPKEFRLFQNYPNPFNPASTIRCWIAERSFVELKIFDVLGREVLTLISEEKDPGDYKFQLNASGLMSGVYIYTINAGEFRDSRKFILLK